jgi:hypothetical protein
MTLNLTNIFTDRQYSKIKVLKRKIYIMIIESTKNDLLFLYLSKIIKLEIRTDQYIMH